MLAGRSARGLGGGAMTWNIWMLVLGGVLVVGLVVSSSTRFVLAKIGAMQAVRVEPHSFGPAARPAHRLVDVEGDVARLLAPGPCRVRVVRCDDGVIHCSVVAPLDELMRVIEKLSDVVDDAFAAQNGWPGPHVVITTEAA